MPRFRRRVRADQWADQSFKVPANTHVWVSDTDRILHKHTMKKEMVFSRASRIAGTGVTFYFEGGIDGIMRPINRFSATDLTDRGYYVFVTRNLKWPWLVVVAQLIEKLDASPKETP